MEKLFLYSHIVHFYYIAEHANCLNYGCDDNRITASPR